MPAREDVSERNAIEHMFGRQKDFSHVGTRDDRRANVFLSNMCLTATASY